MRKLSSFLLMILLAGCSFAPKFERPFMPIPANYKESGKWIAVKNPILYSEQTKPWWTIFQDETLNVLEQQVSCNNQNLKIAWARFMEARATVLSVASARYPQITGFADAARQKTSRTLASATNQSVFTYNTFMLGAVLNYEIDLFGRVKNAVIASQDMANASAFDLAALSLTMHADLASYYFKLRGDDVAQSVLDSTVIAYQKALYLTKQRFKGGIAAITDVYQAMSQLETAKTLATDLRLERAQFEHAIAVLIGEIPANFRLRPKNYSQKMVMIAPDLPSTLLIRRPDVMAALERVKSANANIGVARAAFFPSLNLVSLIGFQSSKLSNLFSRPSLIWSLGPPAALSLIQNEVSQVLFDGFNLIAKLKLAKASYFEMVATYRQTALTAFQEVEDALVAIRRLDEEKISQALAATAAKNAWFQSAQRYKGGIATFLDVVITENEALQAQLALIHIKTRRQLSTVLLIKALGGGWNSALLGQDPTTSNQHSKLLK